MTDEADLILNCWRRGMGLGETVKSLRRRAGSTADKEAIRRRFADFSHGIFT